MKPISKRTEIRAVLLKTQFLGHFFVILQA